MQWIRLAKEQNGENGEDGIKMAGAGADKDYRDEGETDAEAPGPAELVRAGVEEDGGCVRGAAEGVECVDA